MVWRIMFSTVQYTADKKIQATTQTEQTGTTHTHTHTRTHRRTDTNGKTGDDRQAKKLRYVVLCRK